MNEEMQRDGILNTLNSYAGNLSCKQLLDLGSGGGGLVVALSNAGYNCTGVEIKKTMCAMTLLRGKQYGDYPKIINGVGEALPFGNETFDLITCYDVLEHTHSPQATLSEMSRVLGPVGVVFVTIHNRFTIIRELHYKI